MASEAAEAFLTAKPFDIQINEFASKTIETNRKVLCLVISCIVFSGNHDLPLRGKESSDGGFQDLCNFRIDAGDTILQEHFEHGSKNASYKLVRIQNEINDICGQVIRREIFEVKKANYYAILADETADISGREQLSTSLRYFDEEAEEIREEFTEFVQLDALNAPSIAKAIDDSLTNHEVDPLKCIGLGFDGFSTMSGKEGGVQAILKKKYSKSCFFSLCVTQIKFSCERFESCK
ncbi:52 kDa repressor of the inhibitor of the protein kinase-like [Diabrotica undecimpunctata]|uniref:52 kDa repressor of the inhibitor of the protein kinase-like n=1 Tax=Diabrotica undecimpunctata TaxID=50387 RepID=UPI003B63F441